MLIEMKAANRAELARTEDPGADFSGTKTKIATSCGNVFETNILLASAESVRSNGNQQLSTFPFYYLSTFKNA